jgi:hypothetical protein
LRGAWQGAVFEVIRGYERGRNWVSKKKRKKGFSMAEGSEREKQVEDSNAASCALLPANRAAF